MQADMKFAMVPAATAFIPSRARSDLRDGRQRSDAAHLNRHRTQIRESAQRIRRDHEGSRIERVPDFSQIHKRHKFIQDQARAQQIADGRAVVVFHSQQPRDRREDVPQNRLHRRWNPADDASSAPRPESR